MRFKNYIFLVLAICASSCSTEERSIPKEPKQIAQIDSSLIKDSLYRIQMINDYSLADTLNSVLGDVNNDGKKDSAFIYPLTFFVHKENVDSQYVFIKISCYPELIKQENAFSGMVVKADDLDGDGHSEIIYCPDWYQSVWRGFYVYSHQKNVWKEIGHGTIKIDLMYEKDEPEAYLRSRVKKKDATSFIMINHHLNDDADVSDTAIVVNFPN